MIVGYNPFDIIAIIIILNTLYNDFETIIAIILEIGNKTIKKIQSIIQLKEAKYKAKQLIN